MISRALKYHRNTFWQAYVNGQTISHVAKVAAEQMIMKYEVS